MDPFTKDRENGSPEENNESGCGRCTVCDKEFTSEKSYFGHLRVHSSGEEPSGKIYADSPDFLEPESPGNLACLHYLSKPFKCMICENVFDRASQLDYHRRSVHLGEKSQICQICGKAFFRKNDLQTHLNVHLGTNQLICEVCGRKFNHVSNLIRHCRTHAGTKPYPCTICGKRFTQISSLSRHKNIHRRNASGETKQDRTEIVLRSEESVTQKKTTMRQHYCRICGETFQFMVLLRQHKRMHTKIAENVKMPNLHNGQDEKIMIFHDPVTNNSIGNLIDLDKINSIEIERDVSISDILSPYNCNDIELSNEENLGDKLYGNSSKECLAKDYDIAQCLEHVDLSASESHVPLSMDPRSQKTQERIDKLDDKSKRMESVREYPAEIIPSKPEIAKSKVYIEVEGISSAEDLEGIYFESNEERRKREKQNLHVVEKPSMVAEHLDLKIHENEMEEKQFYELIINSKSNDFEDLHSKIEKSKEQFSTRMVDDNVENVEEQNDKFGNECCNEFQKYLQNPGNCREVENCMDQENTPMVRLVQNEDGEQFFELVREPLEYEKNRGVDKNPDPSCLSAPVQEHSEVSHATNASPGTKREKKEIPMESGPKVVKSRARKFKCNECDKWFSTAYNFRQHAGTHFFDQQKYRCEHCGLSFAWKSTLNKHLAGNHRPDGPQKFVCEICPKVYSTLSQVNEHVKRDHLKERNHMCTLCGKSFFKKFDLKTHSRTHTKERPYICRACGKGFHHQSHIIRHERIHSGERPYECQICQKTFAQPSSLKAHRQRHREVRIDILEYRMDEDDPLTLAVQ